MKLIAAIALALLIASPVSARAQATITGPDGAHFGESHGVTFDGGKARVTDHYWWATVECYENASTILAATWSPELREAFEGLVYREFLHLGPQEGFPINDNLMTFGPTSAWSGGGADCVLTLRAYDGNGGFNNYATDDFEVLP